MKKIIALIVIAVLAITIFVYQSFNNRGFIDNEYITDDGFYLRFDGIQCDPKQNANVLLGLSPVRGNNYDSCQTVDIKLVLLKENDRVGNITYLWDTKNCVNGKVRQEAVAINLSNYFKDDRLNGVCENRNLLSLVLQDYKFIASPKPATGEATSDPLGQQARLDSSIPHYTYREKQLEIKSIFSDQQMILLIQKKLSLLSDYEGPFDGVWNSDMELRIKRIQDDNLVFFDEIKSFRTLELLGLTS